MKPPTCDPGDFCVAQGAESTLFIPEIAKSAGTPKRFQHVSPFPFFEVGLKGWIVRVGLGPLFAPAMLVTHDGRSKSTRTHCKKSPAALLGSSRLTTLASVCIF
jgi:hypothetical protein